MKLYHGTLLSNLSSIKGGINLAKCKALTDFGRGFYLTTDFWQAYEWAMARKTKNDYGIVIGYSWEPNDELNIKRFSGLTNEWAKYIVNCRLGDAKQDYDIVIGCIADVGVSAMKKRIARRNLTIEKAIQLLKRKSLGNQYAFKSQLALKTLRMEDYILCKENL